MTKCICGVDISPDNVKDHQGCGNKIFQDSDMTIPSIKETVAENKQRAIPFPSYTGEVVDFLLGHIDTLTKKVELLSVDAEKFRALMASARFRMHGGAGIGESTQVDPASNYAHISLDLFTKYGETKLDDTASREYFLGYIDVAVKAYCEAIADKEK